MRGAVPAIAPSSCASVTSPGGPSGPAGRTGAPLGPSARPQKNATRRGDGAPGRLSLEVFGTMRQYMSCQEQFGI